MKFTILCDAAQSSTTGTIEEESPSAPTGNGESHHAPMLQVCAKFQFHTISAISQFHNSVLILFVEIPYPWPIFD